MAENPYSYSGQAVKPAEQPPPFFLFWFFFLSSETVNTVENESATDGPQEDMGCSGQRQETD
jgi:hypothetical protein